MSVSLKSAEDVAKMRVAGALAAEVLDYITPHVVAGVTTGELDQLCHEYMVNVQDTVPAPLNYAPPGYQPYPASICTSSPRRLSGITGDKSSRPAIWQQHSRDQGGFPPHRTVYVGAPPVKIAGGASHVRGDWRGFEPSSRGHLGDIGAAIQHMPEAWLLHRREFAARKAPVPRRRRYCHKGARDGLTQQTGWCSTSSEINAGRPGNVHCDGGPRTRIKSVDKGTGAGLRQRIRGELSSGTPPRRLGAEHALAFVAKALDALRMRRSRAGGTSSISAVASWKPRIEPIAGRTGCSPARRD